MRLARAFPFLMLTVVSGLAAQSSKQRCVKRSIPTKLPGVATVVDSAMLTQFIREDSLPAAEFDFAVSVDSIGRVVRFHAVPGSEEPTARLLRTVGAGVITENVGHAWSGRVHVRTGTSPTVSLQPSEYCMSAEQQRPGGGNLIGDQVRDLTNLPGAANLFPGRAIVQLVVNERGEVEAINLLRKGVSFLHDSLAFRVARLLSYFPALYDKKPVMSADTLELVVTDDMSRCPCVRFTSLRRP